MRLWQHLTAFFQTWYGVIAGTVGIILSVYKGVPALFQTWDFVISRLFDEPLLDVLREVRIPNPLPPFSPSGPGQTHPTVRAIAKEGTYGVGDLANILHRSQHSIGKSIRRLRAQGRIEFHEGGFRLKK
jgi:hypothetical protein